MRFDREWRRSARYAAARGVRIFGDMPIYVADGGADHRRAPAALPAAAPSRACRPTCSRATGQLWGNPLYDWPAMRADGYRWWIERFRRIVRARRPDAHRPLPRLRRVLGGAGAEQDCAPRRWLRGPGAAVFRRGRRRSSATLAGRRGGSRRDHARRSCGCGRSSACPGWSCSSSRSAATRATRTCRRTTPQQAVVYTGTHDNDTALGWWESLSDERARGDRARSRRSRVVADRAGVGARARRSRSRRSRTCSASAARRA